MNPLTVAGAILVADGIGSYVLATPGNGIDDLHDSRPGQALRLLRAGIGLVLLIKGSRSG